MPDQQPDEFPRGEEQLDNDYQTPVEPDIRKTGMDDTRVDVRPGAEPEAGTGSGVVEGAPNQETGSR